VTAAMESLTTDSTGSAPMEVDEPTASGSKAKEKQATPAQQHQVTDHFCVFPSKYSKMEFFL